MSLFSTFPTLLQKLSRRISFKKPLPQSRSVLLRSGITELVILRLRQFILRFNNFLGIIRETFQELEPTKHILYQKFSSTIQQNSQELLRRKFYPAMKKFLVIVLKYAQQTSKFSQTAIWNFSFSDLVPFVKIMFKTLQLSNAVKTSIVTFCSSNHRISASKNEVVAENCSKNKFIYKKFKLCILSFLQTIQVVFFDV